MIDARIQHCTDAEYQRTVIEIAVEKCGTLKELCGRSGLTRDYLTKLRKGQASWTFQVQYLIEQIKAE